MRGPVLVCATLVMAAAALAAQTSQPNPYSGTSNPPPDSTIIDNTPPPPAPPPAKPSPAHPVQPAAPAPAAQPAPVPVAANPADGTDDGIVQVAPGAPAQPELQERAESNDPDGGIVHPAPLPPGELAPGTEIRVRLLDRLSTANSQSGDRFRCRVASDVFRGNDILIPAGAEIDGSVVEASSGHFAGHGSMLLRPETVILPDGSHYHLFAQTTGAPEANARVGAEGTITPGSRLKKDGIEYGGAVGAGVIAGGVLAGPPGALAGTLIGAGAVTAHLLVNHAQATLEPGTVLMFSLTEPLNLAASAPAATGAQPSTAQPDQAAPAAPPAPDSQSSNIAPPVDSQQGAVSQN
jgi:hypothetical protein